MSRRKAGSGSLSRREFLGATATVALSTDGLLRTARAHDAAPSTPWYSVMRRCGQIRDRVSSAAGHNEPQGVHGGFSQL